MLCFNQIKNPALYITFLGVLCSVLWVGLDVKANSRMECLDQESREAQAKLKIEKYNLEYEEDFLIDKDNVLQYYEGTTEKKVVIPDRVKAIGRSVFSNHDEIVSIELPEGLLHIDDHAFLGCTRLREIKIPDSVKEIGNLVFSNCPNLEKISIGSGVEKLGYMCFWICNNLISIEVSEDNAVFASYKGVLYDKKFNVLIKCPQGFGGKFTVLKKIKKIGDYAFAGCSNIEKILLNDEVEYIGESAFFDCRSLMKINLGKNLHRICSGAFSECILLDDIEIPEKIAYIDSSVFYQCRSLRNVLIKSKHVVIDRHVFSGCHKDFVLFIYEGSTAHTYVCKEKLNYQIIY